MSTIAIILSVLAIGSGATLVMDAWLVVLRRLGVRTASIGLIGRWVAHMPRGRFLHASIAKAAPVERENALGWAVHYAIGVVFAGLLVAMTGTGWIQTPTWVPALMFGVVSVAAPLLVMQPTMGSGLLASKTPTPWANCLRSLVNHSVFGMGLYASALAVAQLV
ncbi:MAG: DUF2938 domain-containing protein [Xanthomonadaceae bacterium]|nr:DUF2938 domain-containing protein [Xanthomonadaceae bacterium]